MKALEIVKKSDFRIGISAGSDAGFGDEAPIRREFERIYENARREGHTVERDGDRMTITKSSGIHHYWLEWVDVPPEKEKYCWR